MNKWIIIKVQNYNNTISFMKSNRDYNYNEITNILGM
jgi:hypothetical protein